MNEKNGRFRKKRSNFSIVSNEIIRDSTISLKAKGLYALIQSYITLDGFILYKRFLQSKCREGREAFESAWKELKDTGYLVQYRMQEEGTKRFYWEYELLDQKKPYTEKPYDGYVVLRQSDVMGNRGNINNTESINTDCNNTHQSITVDDVMEQIQFSDFSVFEQGQAHEIAMLITDVLNMPDNSVIRIMGQEQQAETVKARFRILDHYHIVYVIESIKNTKTEIKNVHSYLLTALYNAPTTLETSYQNEISAGL